MSEMVGRVARALMDVCAAPPASDGRELPVLAIDPDFDDLPRDHTEGNPEDEITQEAVIRLARAAIEAMREPSEALVIAGGEFEDRDGKVTRYVADGVWRLMIDAALS